MQTIYYDTLRHGLIPVQFIGWAKTPLHAVTYEHNAVVKIRRTIGPWQAGEILHLPKWCIVVKSHQRSYQQYVKPAPLPPIDEALVMPARV